MVRWRSSPPNLAVLALVQFWLVVAEYDAKLVTAESVEVPHNIQEAAAQEARNSGTSWYAAVFLVVNAALGAGLLNFPQAFDRAGGLAVALSVQAMAGRPHGQIMPP
ncbi:hypothetical protein IscW_ISCW002828 [Ixodes scapularis]|uniref:Uncharacterized protein n=1 Tax=Ixodes scapularis TaxID=6945 RepID=B7PAL8_IXOSC|nr:hypothetical protein IscW_ISCW002828 [Ixodes scapularis]|eukprot:XP_002407013.1 hypothetical protein IscW_ISCW002828 [Ixodes scapularis]